MRDGLVRTRDGSMEVGRQRTRTMDGLVRMRDGSLEWDGFSSNPPPLSQGLLPRYNLNKSKNLLLLNKPFSPKPRTSINCSSVSSLTPQLDKSPAQTLFFEEEKEEEKEEEEPLSHFFEKLDMANCGYEISRYLYATSNINLPNFFQKAKMSSVWSTHANWMGYVAVTTDEEEVKRLGRQISITITGHSLGAALATLSAYDIAEMRLNIVHDGECVTNKIPITVYSFAGPRVGNLKFKERCDELGVKVLRVINVQDKVPNVPGIIANEKFQFQKYVEDAMSFPWSYAHVGVELALDHTHSPFLKPTNDMGCAHNLEAHLHLVDGYHGKERRFCLVNKRDIALVNKCCDFLKSEYGVPPCWRQDKNKGMVRNSDGRWVLPERPRLEAHPPDTAHHLEQVLKTARSNNDG
ncbi:phospholipase a1-igamma3 [Quercus suber]|uniref:Phospholipase a1-igamma3 n=1 Tax=Quercus suber TaxID=58331 RepID=A0AAW0JQH1_QUESU